MDVQINCAACGAPFVELEMNGRKLAIHHVDYNKENCQHGNLMATCLACNSMFNARRDYWQSYLPTLIG